VTLWSVLCYIVQSTVNNVHCKAHCVTLYRAKLIVYTIKRTVLHCTGHSFSVNCKVYCVSLYRAQLLVYIVLCVPCHCTLYNWCAWYHSSGRHFQDYFRKKILLFLVVFDNFVLIGLHVVLVQSYIYIYLYLGKA